MLYASIFMIAWIVDFDFVACTIQEPHAPDPAPTSTVSAMGSYSTDRLALIKRNGLWEAMRLSGFLEDCRLLPIRQAALH